MDDLRRFDLNLLVAFNAMMDERNVSRAARRLSIGQPAMSHALTRLREIFNDPLFVRAGGTMTPTPRALSLAIPVAEVLADIRRNVLAGSAFDPLTDHQVFRVGVSDYAEIAVIRPVLLSLRQQGPGMQVVLEHTDRDRVGAMLEVGAIDLAIGFYPDPQGQMRSETLFREDFACIFDPEACGMQPPIGLNDYLSLPHLMMSLRGEIEGHIDALLRREKRSRFVVLTTPHFLAIPNLLHGLRAVAAVPRRLAQHCAETTRLAVCDLPVPSQGYDVSMVWHARTDLDPPRQWIREVVRQEGRRISHSGRS